MCEFICLRFKCQIPLNSQWVNVLRTMKLAHIQKHENARLNHVCFWNIWILQSCIAIASHQRDHLSMFRFVIESHCEYHMIKSKRNMISASYDYFFAWIWHSIDFLWKICTSRVILSQCLEKQWKVCEQSKIILEQHIRIQFQCNHTGSVEILFVFQFPFCAELRSNIEYERVKRNSNFNELLSVNHL